MKRYGGVFAILAALALLGPGGALRFASAQVPDSARQRGDTVHELPPIEVRASIAPTASPTIGSGIPARISTVTGAEIDAWEPRLVTDVLATQPGVSLYDDLGTPYKLNLSTRGFNVGPTVGLPPGVTVFLDGIRQNEPDAQEVNFDLLPMEHVKRVELLSGSASLLGPNSLGGAVNLITRRGAGPLGGELEVSGGSFDAYSPEGSLSGRSRTGWDYYAASGYEHENGWRAATGAENYNGFLNLGRLGERRGISLQAFGAKSRAETAGSLPESIFDVSPKTNFTPGDFENLNTQEVALSGYAPVGPGRWSATTYYRRFEGERFNVNQAPDPNVRGFTTNHTVGTTADWRWGTPLGTSALAFRVGLDGAAHWVRVRIFGEPQEGEPAAPGQSGLTTDVRSPSWDLAGYVVADYRVGRVTLSGGARYDYIRIPFRNLLDPAGDTTNTFDRLSPRGGVNVDLGQGASAYASVGQSFRAPAILELGCADPQAACPLPFALGEDPPLKPVKATTYEVGGQWVTGPAILSGSLYRTDVRDEIFFVASETARLAGFFTNLSRTRREGVELSVRFLPAQHISLYASYAYTSATFRTNAELFSIRSESAFADSPLAGANEVTRGDQLPLVPDNQVKFGGLVGFAGFEVGIDGRWIGGQWLRGDEANEVRPLEDYFVTNARVGYRLGAWEISSIVSNLFDSKNAIFGTFNENRQTGELERFLTPMNARAVKLIVRRSFGGQAASGGQAEE